MNKFFKPLLTVVAVAGVGAWLGATARAQVLFQDTFETDTAADWTVLEVSENNIPDYTAVFHFDYAQQDVTINGVTQKIPLAPNSQSGATHGVKMTVNKDNIAARAAVGIFLKNQTFSGNYALRADMWINYNGGRYGGSGSTEFGMMGLNHSGTVPCGVLNDTLATESIRGDGLWFRTSGEGGAARDFRRYVGDAGTSDSLIGTDHGQAVFLERFPAVDYESPGAVGKRWVQVEVAQRNNHIVWKINGYVIAEFDNDSAFTSGTVMVGTLDAFSSIANPKGDNFVIFDNVRVVDLDQEPAPSTVKVEATDPQAAEPGDDTGTITVTRLEGDQTQPLEVTFRLGGTATPGVDYATNDFPALKVTIPANADSTTVTVKPIDDFSGEPLETVILTLTPSTAYEMRDSISATVELADDGDIPLVQVRTADAYAYERLAEDTGVFDVYRLGDTAADSTVNLSLGGTASPGADYESINLSVVIPAGQTNALVVVTPKDDPDVEGNETVALTVQPGAGYKVGPDATATVTILDDDQPPAPVLFSDDFETDSSAQWQVRFGAANDLEDYTASFAYDYSADGIPSAPHSSGGTTKGLKLTVNKNEPTDLGAAALNLYAKDQRFSGDFALRFDMYLHFDSSVGGTTEHAIFGVNHSGSLTNRHNTAGSDGVWFAIETDGSGSGGGRSYVSYLGNSGLPAFQSKSYTLFTPYFTNPPYQAAGAPSGQWADVEIGQVGGVVTLKVNGVEIFRRTDTSAFASGTIMLGHMDTFNSIGAEGNYTIFDNVRVVNLQTAPPPQPTITSVSVAAGQVEIVFTSESGSAASFTLLGSATVNGPYAPESGALIVSTGVGQFKATAPLAPSPARFYLIRR